MTTAVGIEVFQDFAEIAAPSCSSSTNDTTIKQFKKELAWNAAYYKLAGGL